MINFTSTTSSSHHAQLVIADAKQESSITKAESANITITSIDGDGVTVSLSETSQSYYHQSKVQVPEVLATMPEPEEQSPAQTAQNIIEPVRKKLSEAQDSGADRQELRGLLHDAQRGFKQGFREAVKTIHHSGNMDPELRSELTETRQLVRQGLKELTQEFLPRPQLGSADPGTDVKPVQADNQRAVDATTIDPTSITNAARSELRNSDTTEPGALNADSASDPAGSPANDIDHKPVTESPVGTSEPESFSANAPDHSFNQISRFSQSFAIANRNAFSELQSLAESVSASYDRSQSVVIEITTQDGDTISIDIASAINASKTISGNSDFEFSMEGQNSNSFVIEGKLDADEIAALNSILEQVEGLAAKFFNGDVAAAFEDALAVGLDPSEIASFSLALNQSTTIEASRAYLASDGSDSANQQMQKQSRLASLGDYVADMRKAMETATKFSNAANMVDKLLEKEAFMHHDQQPQLKRDLFNQLNENVLNSFYAKR